MELSMNNYQPGGFGGVVSSAMKGVEEGSDFVRRMQERGDYQDQREKLNSPFDLNTLTGFKYLPEDVRENMLKQHEVGGGTLKSAMQIGEIVKGNQALSQALNQSASQELMGRIGELSEKHKATKDPTILEQLNTYKGQFNSLNNNYLGNLKNAGYTPQEYTKLESSFYAGGIPAAQKTEELINQMRRTREITSAGQEKSGGLTASDYVVLQKELARRYQSLDPNLSAFTNADEIYAALPPYRQRAFDTVLAIAGENYNKKKGHGGTIEDALRIFNGSRTIEKKPEAQPITQKQTPVQASIPKTYEEAHKTEENIKLDTRNKAFEKSADLKKRILMATSDPKQLQETLYKEYKGNYELAKKEFNRLKDLSIAYFEMEQ